MEPTARRRMYAGKSKVATVLRRAGIKRMVGGRGHHVWDMLGRKAGLDGAMGSTRVTARDEGGVMFTERIDLSRRCTGLRIAKLAVTIPP